MASLVLNGNTSGSVTISSPAVSGSNTLTLPANTGTVITTASTFAGTGPAFSAYQSSATSLTSGVFVKIALQTEDFDTNNCFDNATNYRFTPNVAGYYQIIASVTVNTTATVVIASIYKNGSENKRGTQLGSGAASNSIATGLIYLNGSTDYVEMYGYQAAATQNTNTSSVLTYFQGTMVRTA